jgi:putative ABC transport system substrate-binding protein
MRRREFRTLSGIAATNLPWPALASELAIVAVLVPGTAKLANDRMVAIRKGMLEASLTGGVSCSADLILDFRLAGIYAAKIISGEKPGDPPIEQASKFILVFNLKTAKSLGISAPDSS